jgi:hypothetical protein
LGGIETSARETDLKAKGSSLSLINFLFDYTSFSGTLGWESLPSKDIRKSIPFLLPGSPKNPPGAITSNPCGIGLSASMSSAAFMWRLRL